MGDFQIVEEEQNSYSREILAGLLRSNGTQDTGHGR